MQSSRDGSLRHEPAFVRWATAEGVSMLGTAVSTVVLPLVVYEQTGSAAQTSALFALRVVPYLFFGLIAGPLADRENRKRMIIGGNVAEGLLVATIPIAHALGVLTMAQVYVVAVLSATAFVFSDAAVFGALPALVGTDRLARANGFLSAQASAAEIVGPALGGVLATAIGATNALWVDAASFLGAAAVQSTIRAPFRQASTGDVSPGEIAPVRFGAHVRAGLTFVRRHRTIATLIGVGFGNSFAFGVVIGLLVPYAVEQLGVADGDGRIGLLFSAGAVGSLVSGLVFGRLYRAERVRWLTPGTLALSAFTGGVLAASTVWAASAGTYGVYSFSIATTIMVGITYRATASPDHLRSSVNVLGRMVAWGGQPFGAAVGGIVADAASVRVAYVMAAGVMAGSAVAAAVLLRDIRQDP